MSRRGGRPLAIGATLAALLIGSAGCRGRVGGPSARGGERSDPSARRTVTLYFPGPAERLVPEERTVTGADESEIARAILLELLAGPRAAELYAPLPEGVELTRMHIGRTGVAYVDLATPEGTGRPRLGSQQELLAAYSLVNSLCENLPELAGVALLWNGTQGLTFAGNLDTRRPLTPNRALAAPAA